MVYILAIFLLAGCMQEETVKNQIRREFVDAKIREIKKEKYHCVRTLGGMECVKD